MKFLFKLAFSIIGLGFLGAGIIFSLTWTANVQTLEKQATEQMEEIAFHVMNTIDRFFFYRSADLRTIATDPIISSKSSTPQEITKRLCEFRDTYKSYVSLSFFNMDKVRLADTSGLGIGTKETKFNQWEKVLNEEISIGSDIDFSLSLELPVVFFASLVKDSDNTPIGFVLARLSMYKLHEIVGAISPIQALQDCILVDLVDKEGLLLYSNHNTANILKESLSNWRTVGRVKAGEQRGSLEKHQHFGEEQIAVFYQETGYLDFPGNGWTLILHIPTRVVLAPILHLRNEWLLVIIPIGLLVLLTTMVFAFRTAKPLQTLRTAALTLGQGKLETRVHIQTKDELEELGKTFNQMAEAIEKTTTDLEELAQTLENKVEERTEEIQKLNKSLQTQSDKLQIVNEELRKIDQQKTEFMAVVSHELRTPLGVMKEGIEQIIEGLHGNVTPDQKEMLSLTLRNVTRLSTLINNLLDVTKIEAGKIELRKQPINIVGVIKEVCSGFELLAQNKGIELKRSFQKEDIEVVADKDAITQVVTNLLNNAFKFTEKGFVSVSVALLEKEALVECCVADSGIGISKENLPKIFQKFQQFGVAVNAQEKGSGLGLSICKGIIKLHDGTIRADSEFGKGSTFTFTLPLYSQTDKR